MTDAQTYAMVVGALGVGAGALKLAQLVLRRNGNSDSHSRSGNLSPEEWEGRFSKLMSDANARQTTEIMNLLDTSNARRAETLRALLRDEIDRGK